MQTKQISNYYRINITLPAKTVKLLEHATKKRNRSKFIAQAVESYIGKSKKTSLRKLLIEGYKANAKESVELAEEGMALSEEAWELSQGEQ